jgi:DNA-binding CsgD family transcriptional regulator
VTGGQTGTLVFSPQLNAVIHDLHDGAMLVPAGEFQRWALRQLLPLLTAGQWHWGIGCAARDLVHAGLVISDPHTRGGAAPLAGRSLRSVLSQQTLESPGTACLLPLYAEGGATGDAVARPSMRLEVCLRDPMSGLLAFFVCSRQLKQGPFSLAERMLLEALAPHLHTAWRHARLAALHAQVARCRAQSAAIVDREGVVHVAESRFFSLLRGAWPNWNGTRVPEPLRPLLQAPGAELIAGVRWNSEQVAGDDAIVLAGTPVGALARLTPGEARVAGKIVAGYSYEQAAESLGISVHTLRNTLVRAYRRLGVCNKVELLRRLEGA